MSRDNYSGDELTSYLEEVDIPVLTNRYRGELDRAIAVEETLKALKTMQSGKTSGPYGIPIEFNKLYSDVLTVRFHTMMTKVAELKSLPQSMGEAVIVVIPKSGEGFFPVLLLSA